jgi:hypothetical protein
MSEYPTTRRRWFQFGLGTLLVVVTVVAVFLTYARRTVLDETTEAPFANVPVSDVMDYLGFNHKFEWEFDDAAFAAAGIDPARIEITGVVDGVTLREALRTFLEPHNLGFKVHDGKIIVGPSTPVPSSKPGSGK